MPPSAPLRVLGLVAMDSQLSRDLWRGLLAYAATRPNWRVYFLHYLTPLESLDWEPSGVLATMDPPAVRAWFERRRLPCVNVFGLTGVPGPVVDVDNAAVGALAARYFLDRGFRQFGYVGSGEVRWSLEREASFRSAVEAAGGACRVYRHRWGTQGKGDVALDREMRAWLAALPRPAAVLGAEDVTAWRVLEHVHELGLRSPEDLAVLGVDDDEMWCASGHPPLSSIEIPARQMGWRAAELLEAEMRGSRSHACERFAPAGVHTRQSSDVLAVDDPALASALAFLRANAARDLSIDELARTAAVARRSLERRFRERLGRTPLEELTRVRMERAQELLRGSDRPLAEIARLCGFARPERLSVVFRRELGQTPSSYRQRFQRSPER